MLFKYVIIFVIYKRNNLNINMCKVHVNYKSLFVERQCLMFMPLAQGSWAAAASS